MKKLLPLTGIRAIAALWVVLLHIHASFPSSIQLPFIVKGYLGVDMFFILSGFVLSYVHQHEFTQLFSPGTYPFMVSRFARIFPIHWLMLFTLGLIIVTKNVILHLPSDNPGQYTGIDFIYHFLNVQAWGFSPHHSWNFPAWSVSAEWFAYLLFPLLTPFVAKLKTIKTNLGLLILCFGLLIVYAFLNHLPNLDWSYKHSLVRVTLEFLIGCGLFNIYKTVPAESIKAPLLSIIAVFGLGVSVCLAWHDSITVMFITLLLFALTYSQGIVSDFLSKKSLVYLGEISYSMYMVHCILIMFLEQAQKKLPLFTAAYSLQNGLMTFGFLCFVILVAHGLFQYVEVPSRKVLRNLLINRPSAPAPKEIEKIELSPVQMS
jgi:peptidoglycan/LPS O-acetylase OafA/YrhL